MIEKNSLWRPSSPEVTNSASFQILEIFAWFSPWESELLVKHETIQDDNNGSQKFHDRTYFSF